jgi:hypothetical protein
MYGLNPLLKRTYHYPNRKNLIIAFTIYGYLWRLEIVYYSLAMPNGKLFKRQAGLFNPDRNHTSRKDPDTGTIRVWKLTDVETVRYARIRQKKENK